MRSIFIVLACGTLAACAQGPQKVGPYTQSLYNYRACLDSKGASGCETERARFEAEKAYVDSETRRMGAENNRRPLVLQGPAREVNCTPTAFGGVNCKEQ